MTKKGLPVQLKAYRPSYQQQNSGDVALDFIHCI